MRKYAIGNNSDYVIEASLIPDTDTEEVNFLKTREYIEKTFGGLSLAEALAAVKEKYPERFI